MFLSCRPFVAITTFSTGLVGVEVTSPHISDLKPRQQPRPSNKQKFKILKTNNYNDHPTVNCPSQETEVTSTPTRPVDIVVITMKGLQDRNINILDGTTVENKGKLIQN